MNRRVPSLRAEDLRKKAEGELLLRPSMASVSESTARSLLNELQVHQIELEMQYNELLQAEEELSKLSLAVEQSPQSIVITDLAGNIEYANAAYCTSSGYASEEVIGKKSALSAVRSNTAHDLRATLADIDSWSGLERRVHQPTQERRDLYRIWNNSSCTAGR